MVLVTGHVVHAVLDRNHAKGVDHVVSLDVSKTVKVVQVTLVAEASGLLGLSILLDVGLRVGQVTSSGGVSTTDGALLEVTLQDITSRKRIAAKHTHVGAVTGVSQKVTLQMLCVQIGLCAMGARKLSISVLDRNHRVLSTTGASGGGGRSTGSTGQNTASALRANNVSRLLAFMLENGALLHHAGSVGRGDAGLGHDTTGRHRAQHRRPSATDGRGCNGLRVRRGGRRLGHHGTGCAISLGRRVLALGH